MNYILCCFIVLTVKIEVSFTIQLELGYIKLYCCTYMVYMFVWRVIVILCTAENLGKKLSVLYKVTGEMQRSISVAINIIISY